MRQRTIFVLGLFGLCAECGQPPAPGQQRDDLPDGSASCTNYSGSYLLGVPVEPACAPSGGTPASAVLTQTGCAASLGVCSCQVSGTVFSCSATSGGMTVE